MRVFLLFALSGFAVLQSGQAQDMEPNPRCGYSPGVYKAPGENWLTTSSDGLRHKWCQCPHERPVGTVLKAADYCVGACLWSDGPHVYEGQNYHNEEEVWEYKGDDLYTYQCICSSQGGKICAVAPGGHVCETNGEVHRPGELEFIVELGDVYSDRWEECECPAELPDGVSRWRRSDYCRGVCFDEENMPHYEGELYNDTLHKCFRFNCVCGDHGGRECVMDTDGGQKCILGRERYNPGVNWIRRTYDRTGAAAGYQECTCPMVWPNKRTTYFNIHMHCRGICYRNATTTIYDDQSPYQRTDDDTGVLMSCECFNAGVEFCHPV